MQNPVRGAKCSHLQPFDLVTYILMNFKSKRWNCPVCGKRTVNLTHDPLTKEICNAADKLLPIQRKPDTDEINDANSVRIDRKDLSI
jgi:hypothetical protein